MSLHQDEITPTQREILHRALEYQEAHQWSAWVWSDVQASPANLVALVAKRFIRVVDRDKFGRRLYLLDVPRDVVLAMADE